MKQTKTYEYTICDFCKVETTSYACKRCGKDVCRNCGVEMKTRVFFECGGDPYYCKECYNIMIKQNDDPLFDALQQINRLRYEQTGWQQEFKERMERAEKRVERLQKEIK